MILIFDQDDPNMARVIPLLRIQEQPRSFLLGDLDQNVEVDHSGDRLNLAQNGNRLTGDDFRDASTILFLRWRMRAQPFVRSTLANERDRAFAEREWDALLFGLLLEIERHFHGIRWINPPSILQLSTNKHFLLCHALHLGIRVPEFTISTTFQRIDPKSGMVTKAISSDELIDADRSFFTSELNELFIERNAGRRSLCPSFLQRKVSPESEVRLYYLLSETFAVRLRTDLEYTDIRTVDPLQITRETIDCPALVHEQVHRFCQSLGLNYCTFDFLLEGDTWQLVDITPNGSWAFYEETGSLEISRWFAATLSNQHSSPTSQQSSPPR